MISEVKIDAPSCRRTLFCVLLYLAPIVGCTNEPGRLKLELNSAPEFSRDALIVLTAALVTSRQPVCLSKARELNWEVRRKGNSALIASLKPPGAIEVHCGTGIMETMILFPYLWIGAWLDVGDLAHRFDVLETNGRRVQTLTIPAITSYPPGDYEISVKLNNRRAFCGDFLPLPLFWQLYSKPVSATIPIRIVDNRPATTQAAMKN